MATIELINVFKALGNRGRPYRLASTSVKDTGPAMTDSNRECPFSIMDLNLFVPDGKTMVLLGPSGCGKTTILRLIAGLTKPDSGEIRYNGINVEKISPQKRRIGMVFQNYALYPHFTSKKNILSYFLFQKKTPEFDELAKAKFQKTSELMGVDIEYLLDKKPSHLSAGEKQRVALGRCITRDPAVFLLDEPFSNLDQKLREKYRVRLKKLLNHFAITAVYVTHDQREAIILADLITIMNIGTVEQIGTYNEIYMSPNSIFVAEFLTADPDTPAINLIDGILISEELRSSIVGVRPEDVVISERPQDISVRGYISHIANIPGKGATIFTAEAGERQVFGRIPVTKDLSMGTDIWLTFNKYHVFDKETRLRVLSSDAQFNR